MAFENISTDDFFPLFKQTLADSFKVDSFFMHAPYHDFEKMDMGLRRMVWGEYSTNSPIFSIAEDSPYRIVVLESTLGFYNMIISLTADEEPDLIGIMPFRTEPINQANINRIMKENGIAPQHTSTMSHFYLSLPVVELNDLILTIEHLVTFFFPAFADHRVEYVNYKSEKHALNPSEERFHKFSSDYIEEMHKRIEACSKAVTSGNQSQALDHMKSLLDYAAPFQSSPLPQIRHELFAMNTFLAARLLETAVHPYYVFNQMQNFDLKIAELNSQRALTPLPFEMTRKYALLAKNYTYEKYSYLIRNVVNYIDQHLATDLSLSVLAEEFDKNPSYLSNAFKKEVGETLTSYIGKQRIQSSLRYFNTTNMSVAEVAEAVGIPDFGYFSKLFKKHVGVSPREYKKMLDK